TIAHKSGLSFLKLYASLNSVPFYLLNRYESLGSAVLQLDPSIKIKCELMRKHL
ncbi:TPA: GNAT family N-acetyltransferase, partial [Neisseria gonorrhoeae]